MYAQGRANALALQEKAPDMTGTELSDTRGKKKHHVCSGAGERAGPAGEGP
nr:MAG TPA: hypothetical protein [Caudoviricetes sp.]